MTEQQADMITCVILYPLSLGGHHENESGLPDIVRPSDDPSKPTVIELERGRAIPLIQKERAVELALDMDFDKAAARLLRRPDLGRFWTTDMVVEGLKALAQEHAPKAGKPKQSNVKPKDKETKAGAAGGESGAGSDTVTQASQGGKETDSQQSKGLTPKA